MQSPTFALPLENDSGWRRVLAAFDRGLGGVIEYVAAAVVLAEIVVLFSGVLSRYVFHEPLVWSDELASTLFLWLSMLGAGAVDKGLKAGDLVRQAALITGGKGGGRADMAQAGGVDISMADQAIAAAEAMIGA